MILEEHFAMPVKENYSNLISKYKSIPYSFSELNTGVLIFNNSLQVKNLFKKWKEYYYKYINITNGWDQPSFRVALWESDVKLCHIPPEYNVRPKSVYKKIETIKINWVNYIWNLEFFMLIILLRFTKVSSK